MWGLWGVVISWDDDRVIREIMEGYCGCGMRYGGGGAED